MSPSRIEAPEVYLLPLDDSGAPDVPGTYINLPAPATPYTLRLSIEGTSSICREGSFWTNIPEAEENFRREKFRAIKLNPTFGQSLYIDIPITVPGTFSYYITYTPLPPFTDSDDAQKPEPTQTKPRFLTVSPSLAIDGTRLPLDSITMHSVLSKFLGSVDKWDSYMKYIAAKGYNMIHFTPLMERGVSNSPFSLFDQCNFDPVAFPNGEKDVEQIVERMEKEYGLLSLTDVVWNHTAQNSEWLHHHPEAGYNRITAPWLESAYQFDTALLEFSRDLEKLGYPTDLKGKEDLLKVMDGIKMHVIAQVKLWEFYVLDVEANLEAGLAKWASGEGGQFEEQLIADGYKKDSSIYDRAQVLGKHGLKGADRLGERYRKFVGPVFGAAYLRLEVGPPPKGASTTPSLDAMKAYKNVLNEINLPFYKEYDTDIAVALEQMYNRIEYVRLADHGPKEGSITEKHPLLESYFTRLPLNEVTKQHDPKALALANNGWLWDNTSDFASGKHKSYLKREVISWGDCVKLRYGEKPEDSPFLWKFMEDYTILMAKNFHGFRIDNCHSTPVHVGEHMLDVARRVRKNLYTVAELFTGDENKDRNFVERLGLSSLIREAMVAWGPQELSRLVHRHGGKPIGSFEHEFVTRGSAGATGEREVLRKVLGSPIHALFMDCTHDNEVPTQKRTAQDTLPNGALSAMCDCAIGSVMGYDEVYPRLLDLVKETRNYDAPIADIDDGAPGIAKIKKLLNSIHEKMGKDGYTEMHVHHEDEYITMHRVHPKSHHGYFLIAHTAFHGGDHRGNFNPVTIPKTKAKCIGSWKLTVQSDEETKKKILEDPTTLRGLPTTLETLPSPAIAETSEQTVITIGDRFPPGSVALFETWVEGFQGTELDTFITSGVEEALAPLNLAELNLLLYRSEPEERDSSGGKDGVYNLPGHGNLVYAGLQGWWSVVKHVIRENGLAHPLSQHLREGQWALDYTVGRIEKLVKNHKALESIAKWFRERFERIKKIPSFLLPRYFALVIQTAYTGSVEKAISLLGESVQKGTPFLKELSLVSLQMTGYTNTASLWPDKLVPSMAAGLPHFAVEWARCWGRDIFISLRGLYLVTGRYGDAKEHILAFASVLKHGMVPNLLGAGRTPRYNARDAIWFYLQAVQDYVTMAPNGIDILEEKVKRRFLPNDDTWFAIDDKRAYSQESTVAEIIQEALRAHALGFKYKEANAGPGLDGQMRDEGFWVEVKPDWKTGFIHGGNEWNCGTWMDKMGESEKAGNKGYPGTPRDGAAVEIIGLLYSTLRWIADLNNEGKYTWSCVRKQSGTEITFHYWAVLIKKSFERCFYIPLDPSEDSKYAVKPPIIRRRGAYKDLFGATNEHHDYQLRPNFPIAMTVAPDLFDPEHAIHALAIADKVLRGPLGMATLDPDDKDYHPNYINSEDSHSFATSKGRNYHQGPEWLWPLGYFLRAMLIFDLKRRETDAERLELLQQLAGRMNNCSKAIKESPWAGLTELTNENGSVCNDSSPTQAWSAACLIDLFWDAKDVKI